MLYGHFGTGTLRHQDTSALVPPDTSALGHFGTGKCWI